MNVRERNVTVPIPEEDRSPLEHLAQEVPDRLEDDDHPVRFVVNRSDEERYECEVDVMTGAPEPMVDRAASIFEFEEQPRDVGSDFNAVLLIPTGIGCEIGGHAGDANATARLLSGACDNLVTHPNVVNASDINALPENGWYVEGSIITRLMMGTIGLKKPRSNRVLVVVDDHQDEVFTERAMNAVNAARASFGLTVPEVVALSPSVRMRSEYAASGRAVGVVDRFEPLWSILNERASDYDAVALSTVIDMPSEYLTEYFEKSNDMVNPWGGVEAMLTHTISNIYDVPTAHAPMDPNREVAGMEAGVVDSRKAAEMISVSYFTCVLKGLQRSPRIVNPDKNTSPDTLNASDISCLVIPEDCIGLPTLAALEQGIPVIAVRENENVMENDLTALPWEDRQLHVVDNYWEAVGVMGALRDGIDPVAVRRPLPEAQVKHHSENS